MEIASVHEAESQLSRLIDLALNGEDVTIAREGNPVVRLVPVEPVEGPRQGGQWKGRVRISDDSDDLPEDFEIGPP